MAIGTQDKGYYQAELTDGITDGYDEGPASMQVEASPDGEWEGASVDIRVPSINGYENVILTLDATQQLIDALIEARDYARQHNA